MRLLKPGDPCPFCGKPLKLTDPEALAMLAYLVDVFGLPEPPAGGKGDKTMAMQCTRPSWSDHEYDARPCDQWDWTKKKPFQGCEDCEDCSYFVEEPE